MTPGKVTIMERDGAASLISRQGEDNVPTEVGIRQMIGKDVNVYDKLVLQLDVKLLFQSLPGAGYLSSEYPLASRSPIDIYGKEGLTWGHGFYYHDPENPNWQIVGGKKIPVQLVHLSLTQLDGSAQGYTTGTHGTAFVSTPAAGTIRAW